ncbi:MAG TPA: N-6 DNA methylase, partial [Polyangiaceae bacterium]|nr:N-6 DNA methylase [Polyangiaceae bacterium]
PELSSCFHQRARKAMLACLRALAGASMGPLGKRSETETVHEALSIAVLRFVVLSLGRARGLFSHERDFAHGRLFAPLAAQFESQARIVDGALCWQLAPAFAGAEAAFHGELSEGLKRDGVDFATCPAELIGNLYELLLGEGVRWSDQSGFELESGKRRKQTGTFFTPRGLTEVVVRRALEPLEQRAVNAASHGLDAIDFRVCDPAVGGGAFLLEVMRALCLRTGAASGSAFRRTLVTSVVHGVDINPIAVAVAEAALCLFVADPDFSLQAAGKNLRAGDSLLGPPFAALPNPRSSRQREPKASEQFDFLAEFPEPFARGGFDLVIGNPPWVAYAGRAAQPLSPERKAYFARHYSTLRGYPTLHGLFVERALRLAPKGTVALVVPSPIADLHGYRAVRRAVRATHTPCEPMLEFGQDAFASVTQPCFALIAEPNQGARAAPDSDEQPFRLAERQRVAGGAAEVVAPRALLELANARNFPRELFGEMGFQTTSIVSQRLLRRSADPDPIHCYPLLEGRDVREFWQGEPRLFLSPDADALSKARCRLRARDDYQRVRFVVRQTARYPIAALHRGLPFRNSLLAGFAVDGLPADLVVGLLNSSLYRALHLALRRDARQAAFPQVKIGHLRALPEPPSDAGRRAEVAEISATLTRSGYDRALAERLDAAVFGLFELESSAVGEIMDFLSARGARRD